MFEDQQPDEQNNQEFNEVNETPDSNTADTNADEHNNDAANNNDILNNFNINGDDFRAMAESVSKSISDSNPELMPEQNSASTSEPQNNIESSSSKQNENNSSETPVTVQPVQFASFDEEENVHGKENRNLDLLMNVNLQMSVELGRTELPFKKVLELTRGSIVSLDKLAGEPVELFANGKLVAFGEVVVIEDNFGLRITSIAAPEERLKTVHETTVSKEKK